MPNINKQKQIERCFFSFQNLNLMVGIGNCKIITVYQQTHLHVFLTTKYLRSCGNRSALLSQPIIAGCWQTVTVVVSVSLFLFSSYVLKGE